MKGTTLQRVVIIVGLLMMALTVATCSSESGDVEDGAEDSTGDVVVVNVTLGEFTVEVDRPSVPAGTPIQFNIINDGTIEHEVVLESEGADREPLTDGALAESIGARREGSFTFTFEEGGSFQLACHIPGHYEAGMVVPITVDG